MNIRMNIYINNSTNTGPLLCNHPNTYFIVRRTNFQFLFLYGKFIYRFICQNSIEEKIKHLQDKKLTIATNVLTGTVDNGITFEDLKLLFSDDEINPVEEGEPRP